MLHILLLILKIIGIVLLCILGVLLLCVGCALFVPVRYRIEAVRKEGEGEPPVVVTVKVTWLLHFVNVLIRFAGGLSVRARLTVFPVFRLPKREKRSGKAEAERRKGRKKPEKGKEPVSQEKGAEPPDGENVTTVSESKSSAETVTQGREGEKATEKKLNYESLAAQEETDVPGATNKREDQNGETDEETAEEPAEEPGKKPTLWDKLRVIPEILRNIFVKIKSIFENIQYTIQNICDKIRSVSNTIGYYKGVIEGEPFRRSFALCKKELLTIFKRLKPDRFEAALIVGMDDPATTGEILAVCGMLYPLLGPQVNVVGDFEKKRLEGRVFIRGKLRFFTFVRVAVRVYFNKDIRKLYGLLKKEAV